VKRLITALTLVVFSFPAGALAAPDAPHFPERGWDARTPERAAVLAKRLPATGTDVAAPDQQSSAGVAVVAAKRLPATGTDVAAPDQQSSPAGDSAPATASTGSDFDWGAATIGAAGAICLAAISLASATAFRRRRRPSPLAG
jgi:hypothetical protein